MLLAPAVGGALAALGEAIRYRSSLTARTREIAILAVAALRSIWARIVSILRLFAPRSPLETDPTRRLLAEVLTAQLANIGRSHRQS